MNCEENPPTSDEPIDEPIIEIKPEEAILYVNYVRGVDVDKMEPGTSATQTFTVENQSNYPLSFNVDWIDVKNDIAPHTTYSYEIIYTFHNLSDIDQTLDQNKVFSAKIKAEVIQP